MKAAAVILLALVLLQAQPQQTPPQQQKPTFRTEANFVRVDAYPTVDGRPVLDLTAADFEVLEDGKPQKIETFEHVVVAPPGPEATRVEPNTVAESRQMVRETRGRVFVVFLDINHVQVAGSHDIRQPLINTLDRLIGSDDMFGVMTPEMDPQQITFGRKTTTIETMLTRYWYWGERNSVNSRDPIDDQYRACYPGLGPSRGCKDDDRGVADEMIKRRREKQTIDSLRSLVKYLRTVREERKAILVVTEGWSLFQPDQTLTRRLNCKVPEPTAIQVDPRTGKLTNDLLPNEYGTAKCDKDRIALANINDRQDFNQILSEANRSNSSFYPIDPRGLPVFDSPIFEHYTGKPKPGSTTQLPPSADAGVLHDKLGALQDMATATDGIAIINNNDLTKNMGRIVADLSSYYLLGYYSTGKLDGKFHSITVRIKRPRVQVRARHGYQALTEREADAATVSAPPRIDAATAAVSTAVSNLSVRREGEPIRFKVGHGIGLVWVTAELDQNRAITKSWESGADAHVALSSEDGKVVASAEGQLARGGRNLLMKLTPAEPLPAGQYKVHVDVKPPSDITISQVLPLTIDDTGAGTFEDALLYRRGPFTGAGWQPVADPQFRRQERIRIEVPTIAKGGAASIRLLGKSGVAVNIPIAVSEDSTSGVRTIVGEASLAPLAAADYVFEVTLTRDGQEQKTLCAFRLVS